MLFNGGVGRVMITIKGTYDGLDTVDYSVRVK